MTRESDVYKDASVESESFGRLPVDTLLTLKGQRKGKLLAVEVELEDTTIDGWIERDALDIKEDEEAPAPTVPEPKKPLYEKDKARKRPRSKILVPKDEGLLLRRDPTFFYGLHGGGNFAVIQDSAGNNYYGPGLGVGALVGYHIFPAFTIHAEGAYSLLTGNAQTTSSTVVTGTNVQFGFFDSSLHIRYELENIEFFGFVQYSVGISVNNVPTTIKFNTVQDLSSVWFGGGVGYQIQLNDVIDLSIRGRYGYSVIRLPVGFQTFSLGAFIQFHG